MTDAIITTAARSVIADFGSAKAPGIPPRGRCRFMGHSVSSSETRQVGALTASADRRSGSGE